MIILCNWEPRVTLNFIRKGNPLCRKPKRAALHKIGHWSKSWCKSHGRVDVCVCVSGRAGWDEQVCDKSLWERYSIDRRFNPWCRLSSCYFLSVLSGWDFSFPASLLSALCQSSLFHPAHNSFCWTPCATLPMLSICTLLLAPSDFTVLRYTCISPQGVRPMGLIYVVFFSSCVWTWTSVLTWDSGSAAVPQGCCWRSDF